MRRIGLLLLAAAGGACSEAPRPPDPRLWTLFDVQALYAQGKPGTFAIANGAGLPGGIALDHILGSDRTTLPVRDAVDLYPVAYVTTEVWTHYDRVWLEPMYVLRTMDPTSHLWTVGTDVQPIFSVGPRSGFYSPFWQTIYVDVPDGTTAESLASVRQIIDSGYPFHPGPGRTLSLAPDGTVVDAMGTVISGTVTPETGQGWLDGAPITFLDFGPSTFTWDEHGVIAETPLYHFLAAGEGGVIKELDVPAVAAAGPPHTNAAAPIVGDLPRYPSYWRLYTVVLPPKARVFLPPTTDVLALFPGLAVELPPMPTDYSAEVLAAPLATLLPYAGHVAIDSSCFTATSVDLETCKWLDTQASLERYLDPGAIAATDITVTCPFVSVGKKPVGAGAW